MKKFTTLTIIFIFSVLMLSAGTLNQIRIVVSKISSERTSTKPRSIEFVPFYCTYDFFSNNVCVEFLDNIGEVTIEVANLSTGEMAIKDVSSEYGYATVSASGTEGEYMLRISTESGDVYEGTFDVE